jgi:hypothetical protein
MLIWLASNIKVTQSSFGTPAIEERLASVITKQASELVTNGTVEVITTRHALSVLFLQYESWKALVLF